MNILRKMKENAESGGKKTERKQNYWNYLFLLVCFMTGARKMTAVNLKFGDFSLLNEKQCQVSF